jgi:hypothetical protein
VNLDFSRVVISSPSNRWIKLARSLHIASILARYRLDGSPGYWMNPEALAQVPEGSKAIVILRDPVKRCLSRYRHVARNLAEEKPNNFDPESFARAYSVALRVTPDRWQV